jgi:hypothetical protein
MMTPTDKQTSFQIAKGNRGKVVQIKGRSTKENNFLVQKSLRQRNSMGRMISENKVYKVRPNQLKNMVTSSLSCGEEKKEEKKVIIRKPVMKMISDKKKKTPLKKKPVAKKAVGKKIISIQKGGNLTREKTLTSKDDTNGEKIKDAIEKRYVFKSGILYYKFLQYIDTVTSLNKITINCNILQLKELDNKYSYDENKRMTKATISLIISPAIVTYWILNNNQQNKIIIKDCQYDNPSSRDCKDLTIGRNKNAILTRIIKASKSNLIDAIKTNIQISKHVLRGLSNTIQQPTIATNANTIRSRRIEASDTTDPSLLKNREDIAEEIKQLEQLNSKDREKAKTFLHDIGLLRRQLESVKKIETYVDYGNVTLGDGTTRAMTKGEKLEELTSAITQKKKLREEFISNKIQEAKTKIGNVSQQQQTTTYTIQPNNSITQLLSDTSADEKKQVLAGLIQDKKNRENNEIISGPLQKEISKILSMIKNKKNINTVKVKEYIESLLRNKKTNVESFEQNINSVKKISKQIKDKIKEIKDAIQSTKDKIESSTFKSENTRGKLLLSFESLNENKKNITELNTYINNQLRSNSTFIKHLNYIKNTEGKKKRDNYIDALINYAEKCKQYAENKLKELVNPNTHKKFDVLITQGIDNPELKSMRKEYESSRNKYTRRIKDAVELIGNLERDKVDSTIKSKDDIIKKYTQFVFNKQLKPGSTTSFMNPRGTVYYPSEEYLKTFVEQGKNFF